MGTGLAGVGVLLVSTGFGSRGVRFGWFSWMEGRGAVLEGVALHQRDSGAYFRSVCVFEASSGKSWR
jgi:hypothetical protein